jgi:hypothetical protein
VDGGEGRGGWLGDALARRSRHPELESILFRRLQELERGPLEQLGELVRAVVDELRIAQRRLTEQARDLRSLQDTVSTLNGRLDELAERVADTPRAEADPEAESGYVLLLPSPDGYRLVERDGAVPALGDEVEVDGRTYRALTRNGSPFPGDRRPSLLAL